MALASSSSSSSSSCCVVATERVMNELTRGREIADRLRLMLRADSSSSSVFPFPAQSLVTQLLDTFTHSLTMLHDDLSQLPSAEEEYSGDSCKTPPPPKDRRGCYKRKRNSETVIKESRNLVEDGHAWRKYGQKMILNAKHPRNYFRCTHKYEQGCQASKQVQRVEDNPPLYRTTYNGHHTCTTTNNHHLISSSSSTSTSTSPAAVIWTFNTTTPTPTLFDSSAFSNSTIVKQEEEGPPPPPPPPQDDYYITHDYSCSASASASASASTYDDNTNIDDISIEDFFDHEFETPLST